jgi:transposase-like protein
MAEDAHELSEPRFYTREFKLEAVRLSDTSEKTVAQIARERSRTRTRAVSLASRVA